MQIKTEGIILREKSLEEDDRLFTVLTKDFGVLYAYGRGTGRIRGRMHAATELLSHSSFVLFKNKGRYILDSAETLTLFFGLRKDLEKLAAGVYFAELLAELAPKEEPALEYLRLMLNTLYFLENGKRTPLFLKALFEMRLLSLAGYMPNLIGCQECMAYESPCMYFHLEQGALYCQECYQKRIKTIYFSELCVPVSAGVLTAMRHLIYADFEKLYRFSLPEKGLKLLAEISEQYLIHKTERTYPSLQYWKSLCSTDFTAL